MAPSTALPDTIEAQIALGLSLATYFTNNPGAERPDDFVTAAKATELTDAAVAAQTEVTTAEEALRDADPARQPLRADLLQLMGTLIDNQRESWRGMIRAGWFWLAHAEHADDAVQAGHRSGRCGARSARSDRNQRQRQ